MSTPANIKTGLESELAGLEARLAAAGDDAPAELIETIERRIASVTEALGAKPKAKAKPKERRPATGTEKR